MPLVVLLPQLLHIRLALFEYLTVEFLSSLSLDQTGDEAQGVTDEYLFGEGAIVCGNAVVKVLGCLVPGYVIAYEHKVGLVIE